MRFKLDENMPAELADLLRTAGHEADTVSEEGLKGSTDRLIASVCKDEKRVLVTFDLDFSDVREYPPEEYPGLCVLRVSRQDPDHLIPVFEKILSLVDKEPIEKHLWIIEDDRVRIRP